MKMTSSMAKKLCSALPLLVVFQLLLLSDSTVQARPPAVARRLLAGAFQRALLNDGCLARETILALKTDTLESIAERFDLPVEDIKRMNPHTTHDGIQPGEPITVPVGCGSSNKPKKAGYEDAIHYGYPYKRASYADSRANRAAMEDVESEDDNLKATLYTEPHLKGNAVELGVGTHFFPIGNFKDNQLSSLKVPAGLKVTVWDTRSKTGCGSELSAGKWTLLAKCNDIASLVVIERD